ncbi:MAG: GAF domain-containing protein [Candidatus Rokubacteria bacterium]|nr:GAF domain-containing protein [Candidatus Rokubacteria bacterium]
MIPLPELIKGLTENLALLLSLACIYGLLWSSLRRARPAVYTLLSGAVFGGIAVAGMAIGIEVMPGVTIGQRVVVIAMAGVFNGPGSAAVAGTIAGGFRLALGGIGTVPGVGAIVTAAVIGALVHRRWGDRVAEFGVGRFLLLGWALTASGLLWTFAIPDRALAWRLLERFAIPLAIFYPLSTVLLGLLLSYLQGERRRLIRTEASIEHSREAMFWVDSTGRIADVNAAATHLCGYSREELRGMPMGRLHDECSAMAWPTIWRTAREQRLLRLESDLRAKDGRPVPIDISCAFLDLETGPHLVYCVRDISERRRAEAETEALAVVGRQLADTLNLAEAASRVVSTLLDLLHVRRALLYRLDAASGTLVCIAEASDRAADSWVGRRVPLGTSVSGRALAERRVLWSPDVLADPWISFDDLARPIIEHEDCRSVMAAPVVSGEETMGTLVVADPAGRVFTGRDHRLLSAFADGAALALRNADLFDTATRRRREAEALAQMARSLSESLDVTEIAERIVGAVPSLVDTRYVILRGLARDGSLVALAGAGPAARFFEPGQVQQAGVGVAGRVVAEGRPVWARDVLDDPDITLDEDLRRRLAQAGIRASLAVPLRVKGKVVGALMVGDAVARDFAPAEVMILEAFADQAALALENARVHEEASGRRREAEVLAEIARSINASLALDSILQRVVEGARELCRTDAASISLRDPASGEMVYRRWTEPRPRGHGATRIVPGKGAGGQVLLTGRPFRTADYLSDSRIDQDFAEAVRTAGTVAMLVVPITIDETIEGLLYVYGLTPRPFSDRDESILSRLADHAGAAIRNARLYSQATERARRLQTLSQLTTLITSAREGPEVFRAVAGAAVTLLGARMARVWIADPEARVLRPAESCGVESEVEQRLMEISLIPFGGGIAGQILETRTPEYIVDCQDDPRWLNPRFTRELGLHAYAGLPLTDGDRVVGVLAILFGEPRHFTAEDRELIGLLADQAAIAIRNAQFYRREQAALAEAQASEARYRGLFDHTPIGLFRTTPDGRILDLNAAGLHALRLPDLETGRRIPIKDFFVDPQDRPRGHEVALREGQLRDFDVRQRRFDGSIGWFRINARTVRDEEGRPVAFEGSAEDITARKDVEEALRQHTKRLEMLHELDWAILATQSPEAIAEAALRGVAKLIPYQHGSVAVLHPGRSEPTVLATYDGGRAWRGKGPCIWTPAVRHMEALREGRPHVTEAVVSTEPPGMRCYLTVPMLFSGELVGAMSLAADGARDFAPEHVEIAREVADPLAVAIQQARLHDQVRAAHGELQRLTGRIVEAQEAERRRIARELHDEVGQVLIGLKLNLEASARVAGEPARARLRGAQVLLTDLIGRLRDLSLDLRPPMLDDLGLVPALVWLFDRYTSHTRVRVTFRHGGLEGQRFPAELETAVYRIVQEALTNAARHAGVDEVSVQLWTTGDLFHVQVHDQGKGFDADSAPASGLSCGLGGMRERAAVLGGRLAVDSRRGAGTLVAAELPLGARVKAGHESP